MNLFNDKSGNISAKPVIIGQLKKAKAVYSIAMLATVKHLAKMN